MVTMDQNSFDPMAATAGAENPKLLTVSVDDDDGSDTGASHNDSSSSVTSSTATPPRRKFLGRPRRRWLVCVAVLLAGAVLPWLGLRLATNKSESPTSSSQEQKQDAILNPQPTIAPMDTLTVAPTSSPTVAPTVVAPTFAPVSTTAAPVATTGAPIATTSSPVAATAAPVRTTAAPVATTAHPTGAPTLATLAPTAPTSLSPTTKPTTTPTIALTTTPPVFAVTNSPTPPPKFLQSGHWIQRGQDLDGDRAWDEFGESVALSADGRTVAGGARYWTNGSLAGQVRVYYFSSSSNNQWLPLGNVLTGDDTGDQLGSSVALSADGRTIAIGARMRRGANGFESGQVRVLRLADDNEWKVLGHFIQGSRRNNRFGDSVAISADGTIVAAGAIYNSDNGSLAGHCRVFGYNAETDSWDQLGQDLQGEAEQDQFGDSVALSADGMTVAAGGIWNDNGSGTDAGQVRVFRYNRNSKRWSQLGQTLLGNAADDRFGISVSLSADGTIVAAGSDANNGNGANSGEVRVWAYGAVRKRWDQVGPSIYGERYGDQFGHSVALSADGTKFASGSNEHDATGPFSGCVRVFEYNSRSKRWNQVGENVNGEAGGDFFGSSVAMSDDGSVWAAGAIRNKGNGYSAGHSRVFAER